MKKSITLILSALLVSSALFSCGGTPADAETGDTTNGADTTASDVADTTTAGDETTSAPETTAAQETTSPDTSDPAEASAYACELDNGFTVTIGAPVGTTIDDITAKLGQRDYMEAVSCVHPGYDKVYTFDGFTVSTSPAADGTEYITELTLISDEVSLANGVMIGSPKDDVNSAFGDNFEEKFGVRNYDLSGVKLSIIFTDDLVSSLSFSKPIE